MTIITLREFLLKATDSDTSDTKIYEGKILTKGPIFSLQNKSSAIQYIQNEQKHSYGLCLLVESKHYFQVWQEIVDQESKKKNNDNKIKIETSTTIETTLDPLKDKFTPEFLSVAKNLLSEYIGPIASIVCKKTLSKNPDLSFQELIDTLAKKIPSPEESQKFQNSLQEWVKKNY